MATLTVQVPSELLEAIERVAEKSGNTPDDIVSNALLIFFGLPTAEA